MRKDTKEDPIIGRKVMMIRNIKRADGVRFKKGTIFVITYHDKSGYEIENELGERLDPVDDSLFTDNYKLTITHYECIKDGKILLSSDEPIEVESIEEFKKNAHKLIVCDDVYVEYKAEQR